MRKGRRFLILLEMCAGAIALAAPDAAAKPNAPFRAPTERAAVEFFGERRLPIYFDATLARQFALGISGGVEEQRALADGARFVATCRPRNCEDKAAVVVDRAGRIAGAGMIGYGCRVRGDGVPPCDREASAFVFVRRAAEEAVLSSLRAWTIKRLARSIGRARSSRGGREPTIVVLD